MAKTDFKTIDEYIASRPEDETEDLQSIRQAIRRALPYAQEVISYQIPAFKLKKPVIYFSAYTNHYSIAIPPSPNLYKKFEKELSGYKTSKSTIQLPKSQPLPLGLIKKLAKFKAKELADK